MWSLSPVAVLESGVCAEEDLIMVLATCTEEVAKLREEEVGEGSMKFESESSIPGTTPPITAILHLGRPPREVREAMVENEMLLMLLGPQ